MAQRRSSAKAKRVQQVRRQKIMILCVLMLVIVVAVIYKFRGNEGETVRADHTVEDIVEREGNAAVEETVEKEENAVKEMTKEQEQEVKAETEEERLERVKKEAQENQYPEDVIKLLSKNPETVEFVEKYGDLKERVPAAKITEFKEGEMPMILQWDQRWGYSPYGTSIIAVCGCGPTCLSMVFSYLTEDETLTPDKLAEYGMENDYINEENDTKWTFMTEAGEDWGINCREDMLSEKELMEELKAGHPVVCSVGPGEFTDKGHFIVLAGIEDGKIIVHDSFSKKNSEKRWDYEEFKDQIKVMWIYSKK